MAILEKEVMVVLTPKDIKYYSSLGYTIPKTLNGKNKLIIAKGTKLNIAISDLPKSSSVMVTKICDICGEHEVEVKYSNITKSRKNGDGKDRCKMCRYKLISDMNTKRSLFNSNCIASKDLNFCNLFFSEADTYTYTCNSHKKVDFICPNCGTVIKNKIIKNVYKQGLSCSNILCAKGKSFPERVMFNTLYQIGIEINSEKTFSWSQNKRYDFYLPHCDTIIEVHGGQHYYDTMKTRSKRTNNLAYEQKNDLLKEELAKNNKISNYIIIDARRSDFDYIKKSILTSDLAKILNLRSLDWDKIKADSFKNIIKLTCEMRNQGMTTKVISDKVGKSVDTVRDYLKLGSEVGWYDSNSVTPSNSKKVVKLSLDGDYIDEYASAKLASESVNGDHSFISRVCRGESSSAYGFIWKYEYAYKKLTKQEILDLSSVAKSNVSKQVCQLNGNLEMINIFKSPENASKHMKMSSSINIISVCKGARKTAGGFKWMYKEEYDKLMSSSERHTS